jgi:hypothetical protein
MLPYTRKCYNELTKIVRNVAGNRLLETQSSMFTTCSNATLIKENTRRLKRWDLNLVSNSPNTRCNKLLLFMTLYPSTLLSFLVAFSILGNLTPYVFISHVHVREIKWPSTPASPQSRYPDGPTMSSYRKNIAPDDKTGCI